MSDELGGDEEEILDDLTDEPARTDVALNESADFEMKINQENDTPTSDSSVNDPLVINPEFYLGRNKETVSYILILK